MNHSPNPIIEVKQLTKKYGDFAAVDRVSFSIAKGEIFAFLGPNGAGKTTVIKMLTTLLRPTSGQALVNGFDVTSQKDQVRRSFGIVFQDQSLDDELTAYENMQFHAVLYGVKKNEINAKIEFLLKLVELEKRKNSLVKTFSSGMKRRLEVARSFLHQPEIIFLDEPTLGLDPQTRNYIWEYILNLNKTNGATVFFTTHYMDEAEETAQKVAIIDRGKIIAINTVPGLKKQTQTKSLHEAYLALVGKKLEEKGDGAEKLRQERSFWVKK